MCFAIFQFPWHKRVWNIWWKIKNVWNHQPDIVGCYISHIPIKCDPYRPYCIRPLLLLHSNGSTAIKKESPRSSLAKPRGSGAFLAACLIKPRCGTCSERSPGQEVAEAMGKSPELGRLGGPRFQRATGKHVFPRNIEFFLQFFPSNPGIVEPIPKSEISHSFLFHNGSAFGLLCWTELYI